MPPEQGQSQPDSQPDAVERLTDKPDIQPLAINAQRLAEYFDSHYPSKDNFPLRLGEMDLATPEELLGRPADKKEEI